MLVFRVMILKNCPICVTSSCKNTIGQPNDFNKNQENNSFPDNVDLRIESNADISATDLEGALDATNLMSAQKATGAAAHGQSRVYEQVEEEVP